MQDILVPGLPGIRQFDLNAAMPSIAPLYPAYDPAEPWQWKDSTLVIVDYLTKAEAAAAWLPAGATLLVPAGMEGQAVARILFADYGGGTLRPYREVVQSILCLKDGRPHLFVAQIWVDTDEALASGRELWGFPKKLADIKVENTRTSLECSLQRGSTTPLIKLRFAETVPLLSLRSQSSGEPLPAPYGLMLGIPSGSQPLLSLDFETMLERVIPSPLGLTAGNVLASASLVGTTWSCVAGDFHAGDAELLLAGTAEDPVDWLAPTAVIGGMSYYGDLCMTAVAIL